MTAQAATKTLVGQHFDVLYDDTVVSLVGAPEILGGSTIFFTPTALLAVSSNGEGWVTVSSDFEMTIVPHLGWQLDALQLTAKGDYFMLGAHSAVELGGQTAVTDVANPVNVLSDSIHLVSAPMTVRDGSLQNWEAHSSLVLAGRPEFTDTEAVKVSLANILKAYTSSFDAGANVAFIENKVAGEMISLSVSTTPEVPEPATLALSLAGGALVARALARRRG